MKITDVRTTVIALPRSATLTTAYGSTGSAITVIVELFHESM